MVDVRDEHIDTIPVRYDKIKHARELMEILRMRDKECKRSYEMADKDDFVTELELHDLYIDGLVATAKREVAEKMLDALGLLPKK